MHVWNVLHAALENTGRKKLPFWHHHTTLSGCIFAAEAMYQQLEKNLLKNLFENLLNTDTYSTCPHNMVNFGWDLLASLGHPCKFQRLSRLGSITAWHSNSGRQPNFAALNRVCHLYSAGRPSRWVLAHILVMVTLCNKADTLCNRADHYIFALWFLSSSSFFPGLISAVGDWMSTVLPHMVWP